MCCQTISERGSPVPSPAYSAAASVLSPGDIISIAQSHQMFSPTLSVSSIIRSQSSTFAGQSPAPTYRPLPSLLLGSLPTPNAFQGQSASVQPYLPGSALPLEIGHPVTGSVWYRYKQADEESLREELSRAEILDRKSVV